MCGIAGQVRFDKTKIKEEILFAMGKSMEHRGRDYMGTFIKKNVGLVHQRLSIIDTSAAGNQPMALDDQSVCIVFNGEIFNYIEIRAELIKKGYTFKSDSDTEVLLKSYAEYGMDFLEHIEGMYALAIVDYRKNKMFLVRDRLGIKPLYYTMQDKSIYFASEIKTLVKTGCCKSEIDLKGLKQYLHIQLYLEDTTLFKNIKTIEPGCFVTVDLDGNGFSKQRYWDIPEEEMDISYEEAVEELQRRIIGAIKLWGRSDVPIGAYISGGLDSSFVATIASKCVDSRIQDELLTFSSIYPNMKFRDESVYSDKVAENIRTNHNRVMLSHEEVIKHHKDLIYALDMPIAGYSAPYRTLSKEVRKHCKVVLTGHGGDEFLCGYPKYISAYAVRKMNEGTRNSEEILKTGYFKYLKGFERQAKSIIGDSLFMDDKQLLRSLFYRSAGLWEYINEDIKSATSTYDVSEDILKQYNGRNNGELKKLLYLDQKILLPGLLHVEDRTSMLENLESRTPLLAREVIEFAARLPEEYLLKEGLKGMMRRVAKDILPDMVVENPSKSGTMFPVNELFFGDMWEDVKSRMKILDDTDLFNISIETLIEKNTERIDNRTIWALWSLACWIEEFM